MAGLLYLIFIVTFACSTFVQSRPIVSGDASATARNILASQLTFRIGCMSDVLAAMLFLLTAWALYALLKPVNKGIALLFLLLNLGGVIIECAGAVVRFGALLVLQDSGYLRAFNTAQLQAMAMFLINLGSSGGMASALFYSVWLFPLGYLLLESRLVPRVLGILIVADGLSMMVCFIQIWLFPTHEKLTWPLYPVMFIAEFGLGLWLLVKGVKEPQATPAALV